jgi:hypothetical protein
MLKLIINNTHLFDGKDSSQHSGMKQSFPQGASQNSFLFDFQELSKNLYAFRAHDCIHDLACEMHVELKERLVYPENAREEEGYLAPVAACDLPHIDIQKLEGKVLGDEYLQGILMYQFQLKILDQLLLFCDDKDAVNLTLTISDADLDYLDIYRRFFVSEEKVITARGEQTQIVIPTDIETYDEVLDFMDEVDKNFRQSLWRDQKVNPAFRKYLMDISLSAQ